MLALGADVVRRKGVDLRDAGHIRNDGRADRASGADKVAVFKRVLHQLLRRHIDNVVVVVEYRVKLGIDTAFHDLRWIVAVYLVHLSVDKLLELLCGIFDLRWEQLLRQKLDRLYLLRYHVGVRNDRLVCKLLAEVLKLLEHLVRRSEVDGTAPVGVGKLLRSLEYFAVLLVLRVEEVNVARRNDGLSERFANRNYPAVVVLKHGLVTHGAVFHKEAVVRDRLYLKVIVERRNAFKLRIGSAVHHRPVQLAHSAGGADEYALSVLYKQAFRHRGRFVEVFEVGLRNHFVEVFESLFVLDKKYHMA